VFIPSLEKTYPMKPEEHKLSDYTYIDYESHQNYQGPWPKCFYRYTLFCEGPHFGTHTSNKDVPKDSTGYKNAFLETYDYYDTNPTDGKITVWGWVWIKVGPHHFPRPLIMYFIEINEEGGSSEGEKQGNIYWEQSCAYQNETCNVEVESGSQFGITTVEGNIIEALTSESTDEFVYTYKGDRGDTRVELICE